MSNWRRVSALNTDKGFIDDMADMVVEALAAPSLSVAEAANSNANSEMVVPSGGLMGGQYSFSRGYGGQVAGGVGVMGGTPPSLKGSQERAILGDIPVLGSDRMGDAFLGPDKVIKTQQAEKLYGRVAMLVFVGVAVAEFFSGRPVLEGFASLFPLR